MVFSECVCFSSPVSVLSDSNEHLTDNKTKRRKENSDVFSFVSPVVVVVVVVKKTQHVR